MAVAATECDKPNGMNAAIFVLGLLTAPAWAADGESFLSRLRYGIDLVRRVFDPRGVNLFADTLRDGRTGEDFAGRLFEAVVASLTGDQQEMSVAGVKISVLVAKWISDAYPTNARTTRSRDDFSPLDSLLHRPQVRELIPAARDPNLTDNLLREASTGSSCLRLLLCKVSPFVRGMQRSLDFFLSGGQPGSNGTERDAWARSRPMERMYLFLPEMTEFLRNGDVCDESHPECVY